MGRTWILQKHRLTWEGRYTSIRVVLSGLCPQQLALAFVYPKRQPSNPYNRVILKYLKALMLLWKEDRAFWMAIQLFRKGGSLDLWEGRSWGGPPLCGAFGGQCTAGCCVPGASQSNMPSTLLLPWCLEFWYASSPLHPHPTAQN